MVFDMKPIIVCVSRHHGNTKRVAREIAGVIEAEIIEPSDVKVEYLLDCEIVGFGSGIYWGKFDKEILNLIDRLPVVEYKKAFIFSTSGLRRIPLLNNFGDKIEKKLSEKGFDVIGNFNCKGLDTFPFFKIFGGIHKGRPNENDFERARSFADSIKREIS